MTHSSGTVTHFTHKGWLGICPVYIADTFTEEPTIEPRHWMFELPMVLSSSWCIVWSRICRFFNPAYDPGFTLHLTGEVDITW
jgi:hypothetical protein